MACDRITAAITAAFAGERPIKAVPDPYNPVGSTAHVRFNTSRTDGEFDAMLTRVAACQRKSTLDSLLRARSSSSPGAGRLPLQRASPPRAGEFVSIPAKIGRRDDNARWRPAQEPRNPGG
jgi:hypothetical protein